MIKQAYPKAPKIITDSAELAQYCERLSDAPYICIDSEFIRERTYWPHFCLAQLAPPMPIDIGEKLRAGLEDDWRIFPVLIDPLAPSIDLTPFYDLLMNPKIIKVFHAARQDLELFWHIIGKIPTPLFDTQLAASVCGYGDQVAYDSLVRQLVGVEIDKSARLTDWALRPLSPKAATYALGDVLYLGQVFQKLSAKINELGRKSWIDEEIAFLGKTDTYINPPEEAYKRIKRSGGSLKFRNLLQQLAAWREVTAQRKNLPRQRILRDDILVDIASHAPQTAKEIENLRSITAGFANSEYGREILNEIKQSLELPQKEWLKEISALKLTPANQSCLELLKLLLKLISNEAGVAARLIATSDELELLAFEDNPDIPALSGWRFKLYGEKALKLKQGKLLIGLDGSGKIKLVDQEG